MAEWIGIAVTAVLTLAGLYFGNSLRLKTRAEVEANVAEKRVCRLRGSLGANTGRVADAWGASDGG